MRRGVVGQSGDSPGRHRRVSTAVQAAVTVALALLCTGRSTKAEWLDRRAS